ncbi:MAG: exodeoxyribonuclease Xth [Myxococcaceae bacterium]|nr:exodeoxyribonuclease Xth [Myxococcaceae bacterium]
MLKLTTWNVNGVRARKAELPTFLDRERPDVLCLQEIKAGADKVPPELLELPGYWSCWHGHKGYSGVALLLSKARFVQEPTFFHPPFDHETRIVVARTSELTVASIYVPNGGKDFEAKLRFLDALEAFIGDAQESGERLLICGDLNVAREERDVHPTLRKSHQIGTTPDERAQFARMLGHGLVDLARKFEPDNERLFTWWAPWRNMREKNIGWRIDYVLASESLAAHAVSCVSDREFGTSDHGPLTATFEL